MVGRELSDVILDLARLCGRKLPRDASTELRRGEILGVAGLIGSGRTELVRAVFGLDPVAGGRVSVRGVTTTGLAPNRMLAQGVGLLSEDRKNEGLAAALSVADNLVLSRLGPYVRMGLVSPRRVNQGAEAWIRKLGIKTRGPAMPVTSLSGGNQQKVAIARLLHQEADVLLFDEPTRGIDVGSKADIYALMGELAAQGRAILWISSYLPELLGVCDTLAVMHRGVLSPKRPAGEWSPEAIMAVATGQGEGTP